MLRGSMSRYGREIPPDARNSMLRRNKRPSEWVQGTAPHDLHDLQIPIQTVVNHSWRLSKYALAIVPEFPRFNWGRADKELFMLK